MMRVIVEGENQAPVSRVKSVESEEVNEFG